MSPQEFKAWLEGFLDGKQSLDLEQIGKIRDKAAQVAGAFPGLPSYPWYPVQPWGGDYPSYGPCTPISESGVGASCSGFLFN